MIWKSPWSNLYPLFDGLLILSALQPTNEVFGVKICPHRIFGKLARHHETIGLFIGLKVVHLSFDLIAIWVFVIHAGCWAMVHTPERCDPPLLSLSICKCEILECAKGERNVFESTCLWYFCICCRHSN